MMLTDSKRRLFLINFVAGLGKGFGQAIGFTVLAALVLYLLSTWVDLPVIGAFIAKLINIVDQYSCLLYTSPSPRDLSTSRMPSSA